MFWPISWPTTLVRLSPCFCRCTTHCNEMSESRFGGYSGVPLASLSVIVVAREESRKESHMYYYFYFLNDAVESSEKELN